MRKLLAAALCAVLVALSGCAAAPVMWETVDDVLPVLADASYDSAYTMAFDVPADAAAAFSDDSAQRVYIQSDGEYEIMAETLALSTIDAVARHVSGFDAGQLQMVKTRRFGMEEYQFAWYSASDEGGRLYRADVLMDGEYSYALVFSVKEGASGSYADVAEQVFSSFNLFYDEKI